jgi:hypothetical protein
MAVTAARLSDRGGALGWVWVWGWVWLALLVDVAVLAGRTPRVAADRAAGPHVAALALAVLLAVPLRTRDGGAEAAGPGGEPRTPR